MTSINLFEKKVAKRNVFIWILAFMFAISLIFAPSVRAEYSSLKRADVLLASESTKYLAPGVTLIRYNEYLTTGFNQFSVLKVDLDEPAIDISPYLANDSLTSPAYLSTIVKSNNLIAGVNADFFDMTYTSSPLSTLIKDGEVLRSPRIDEDFSSIVLLEDASVIIQQLSFGGTATGPNGITLTIAGYNENSVVSNASTIFDLNWPLGSHKSSSASWLSSNSTTIVVVDKNGYVMSVKKGPIAQSDLMKPTDTVGMTIGDENNKPTSHLASPYYEIVARGKDAVEAAKLYVGDKLDIQFGITSNIDDIHTVFSGKPVLIKDGIKTQDLKTAYSSIQGNTKAQRTAVGINEDTKTLYFVVVDGRSSSAAGMTLDELATLMADLGCYNALNLDGGGSSSIVYNDLASNKYLLGSRLASSERLIPYAVGISYIDDYIRSGIPVFVDVNVEIVGSDSFSMPVIFNSSFDSAISGGLAPFRTDEVFLSQDHELIVSCTAKDVFGQEITLNNEDGYFIVWTISGSSSNLSFEGMNTLIFKPEDLGKFTISAALKSTSSETENLPESTFNIRVLGAPDFIQLIDFDKKVTGVEYYPLNISVFDAYGFLIPDKQRDITMRFISDDGTIVELDSAVLPCDIFNSTAPATLIIRCGEIFLTCDVVVEGATKEGSFIPSRVKISPSSIGTTSGKSYPSAKIKPEALDLSRPGRGITLDVSKGGITASNPAQWNELKNFLENPIYKDVYIILDGGSVLNTKGEISGFKDTMEANMFLDFLSWLSDGDKLRINLIQPSVGVPGWMMYNGIKFIWR